jgi:hypothetical protein
MSADLSQHEDEIEIKVRRRRANPLPALPWIVTVWTCLGGTSWTDVEEFRTWDEAIGYALRRVPARKEVRS